MTLDAWENRNTLVAMLRILDAPTVTVKLLCRCEHFFQQNCESNATINWHLMSRAGILGWTEVDVKTFTRNSSARNERREVVQRAQRSIGKQDAPDNNGATEGHQWENDSLDIDDLYDLDDV